VLLKKAGKGNIIDLDALLGSSAGRSIGNMMAKVSAAQAASSDRVTSSIVKWQPQSKKTF
jgi:hypothetical protein